MKIINLPPQEEENDDKPVGRVLSRREILGLLGTAGAAMLFAGNLPGLAAAQTATATAAATGAATAAGTPTATAIPTCVVKPELTEGPYFVDEKLDRSDIRLDPSTNKQVAGIPLALMFRVYRVGTNACVPLANAQVDIWHCDAAGRYSDEAANNTVGQKFLRGYQTTDSYGVAQFTTIYPGWYQGRAVHIHFKIRTAATTGSTHEFTSQLFFDEAFTDEVYTQAPYTAHTGRRQTNAQDGIFRDSGGQLTLAVTKETEGYAARFDIGLNL